MERSYLQTGTVKVTTEPTSRLLGACGSLDTWRSGGFSVGYSGLDRIPGTRSQSIHNDTSATNLLPLESNRSQPRPKTIYRLRRNLRDELHHWGVHDDQSNEESRLPDDEWIRLGGLVLVEAFTPSTVSHLYAALERLPNDSGRKAEWLSRLTRSRRASGTGGGWQNLGVVRPEGKSRIGDGFNDTALPASISAVWLQLFYATPSLTFLVATFSLTEAASDLSHILRANYTTDATGMHIHVGGRLGYLRARIPWSRPREFSMSHRLLRAEDQKRIAFNRAIAQHEQTCSAWLERYFSRGRFSQEPIEGRPMARLILSSHQVPFESHHGSLRATGLSTYGVLDLWKSVDPPGWWLRFDTPRRGGGEPRVTFAAKHAEASEGMRHRDRVESDPNWYLSQRFHDEQARLVCGLATLDLLEIYAHQIGVLRDQAGIRLRVDHPVRQAKRLDEFLLSDGLDMSAISRELQDGWHDFGRRWDLPNYKEARRVGQDWTPTDTDLESELATGLLRETAMLASNAEMAIKNVQASAELRQAVANTRLQRVILLLTILSICFAAFSLFVAVS